MSGFSSFDDYRQFAWSVTRRSRYLFEPKVEDFLLAVAETGASRIRSWEAGSILYRAQLETVWREDRTDPFDPDREKVEVRAPCGPARMKPLRDAAREGRVNPKGIPYLYLADDADTAMAEMRPWIGEHGSLAEFKIRDRLQIMCLPEPKSNLKLRLFLLLNPLRQLSAAECESAVWGEISYAFSEPVSPEDHKADYAPTQILAEAFRNIAGCHGVRYKSRLGKGYSFALFDLDSADLMNCELFETEDVVFKFARRGNGYSTKENYRDR
jgi:hypothetical protein